VLLVPSHSPPGLTQTMASMYEEPVLVVGRVPKPAPLMLHQSPHAWRRFCWPERPWSTMKWALDVFGQPIARSRGK
jgi:hypothetical protein